MKNNTEHTEKIVLNPEQQRAVETIEGPVMVIAGPGTGKTQVLSARIAEILRQTDEQPQNILALTFTESAAHNMRERLVKMIGPTGMFAHISTFHSFCQGVIHEYPEYFSLDRDAKPLTDSERFDLVEHILDTLPLRALKPLNKQYFYIKDILKALSDLKREGVTVAKFLTLVSESGASGEKVQEKQRELAQVYERYETLLAERKRYDFDDMIGLVNAAFSEHADLLSEYQERLHYFLVDEYQDTNTAQNQIVFQLASFWGEVANIFVVGDPHQSIYRFQGASTENIFSFADRFPNAEVITLTTGYRCPQPVYDAAHAIITQAYETSEGVQDTRSQTLTDVFSSLNKGLTSHTSPPRTHSISLWSAQSQTLELCHVAEVIQGLLKDDVPASEIAILYRTNKEAAELTQVLRAFAIPFELEAGTDVLAIVEIQQLVHLLQCIVQLRTGEGTELLFEVLSYPWMGLDTLTLFQLARRSAQTKLSLTAVLELEAEKIVQEAAAVGIKIDLTKLQHIQTKYTKIQEWGTADYAMTLPEWFSKIIAESGFVSSIKNTATDPLVFMALNTLFNHVQQLVREDHTCRLEQFLKKMTVMQSHGLTLSLQEIAVQKDAVRLSTVHKAKGREWEYIFIIHCIDGVWGNGKSREMIPLPEGVLQYTRVSKQEKNNDDRRLFYVALTRAKKHLSVSFPRSIVSDTKTAPVSASLFVHELQKITQLPENVLEEKNEGEVRALIEKLVAPQINSVTTQHMEDFFRTIVADFSLSVTALNNYLRDPEYFVYNDLLRLPQAKAPYLAFGTAVHAALEKVYGHVISGAEMDVDAVAHSTFEAQLKREVMTEDEQLRRLSYGKEILSAYLAEHDVYQSNAWQTERKFGSGFAKTILDDIPLAGRIDRFDWVDREKKWVQVVDYKTGAAKSSNEIEGKTQSAGLSLREKELPESIRGSYKRQLIFYKLLTELDRSFQPTVVKGVFDFVEPDKTRGTFVRREFELVDADVHDLKELIRTVMQEIRELQFLKVLKSK